jgi:hypothetical protein
MLIERLFTIGVMKMGPSRVDPERQVGVFNPEFASGFPAQRAAEMVKFQWLVGEWNFENAVPATRFRPPTAILAPRATAWKKSPTGSAW